MKENNTNKRFKILPDWYFNSSFDKIFISNYYIIQELKYHKLWIFKIPYYDFLTDDKDNILSFELVEDAIKYLKEIYNYEYILYIL